MKSYDLQPIIYSVATEHDEPELKYGIVHGIVERHEQGWRNDISDITITSRMGDEIHISDLGALKALSKVLSGIVTDLERNNIEIKPSKYTER